MQYIYSESKVMGHQTIFSTVCNSIKAMTCSNSLKACICMTLGLCFHFLGYECARAASITLLAAKVSVLVVSLIQY